MMQPRIISQQHPLVRHLRDLRRMRVLTSTTASLFVKGGGVIACSPVPPRKIVVPLRDDFAAAGARAVPVRSPGAGVVDADITRGVAEDYGALEVEDLVRAKWGAACEVHRMPSELLEYVISDNRGVGHLGPALEEQAGTQPWARGSKCSASELPTFEYDEVFGDGVGQRYETRLPDAHGATATGSGTASAFGLTVAAARKPLPRRTGQTQTSARDLDAALFDALTAGRNDDLVIAEMDAPYQHDFSATTDTDGLRTGTVSTGSVSGNHAGPRVGERGEKLVLALDGIQNPSNMGRLFHLARAYGFESVFVVDDQVLPPEQREERRRGSVSPLNWRSLAVSGLIPGWTVPFDVGSSRRLLQSVIREKNYLPLVAVADDEAAAGTTRANKTFSLKQIFRDTSCASYIAKFSGVCLILGSESFGPSQRVMKEAVRVKIEMGSTLLKSLNVHVAGGMLMEEIAGYMRSSRRALGKSEGNDELQRQEVGT